MGSMDVKEVARLLAKTQYDAPPQLGDEIVKIDNRQFDVTSDAFSFLDSEWYMAGREYDLEKEGAQKALVQVALLAAGMQTAMDQNRIRVDRMDIISGWNKLKVCGIGELPHQCLGKSIIDQAPELMRRPDLIGKALTDVVEGLDFVAISRSSMTERGAG